VKEVNSLVRKYNALAPYIVRRPYYTREVEMERMYAACAEDIWRELAQRSHGAKVEPRSLNTHGGTATAGTVDGGEGFGNSWSVRELLREWIESLISKVRARLG